MNTKILAALFAIAAACSSCAHTTPTVQAVGHVVDCTEKAVVAQWLPILSEVGTDLLRQDYIAALEDVGKRVGTDALVCAVKASADGAEARMSGTPGEQPNAGKIKTHASDYLRLKGARFSEPSVPAMMAPVCHPACDACHVCFQVLTSPGVLIPPSCAPRSPAPIGCPR